MNNSRNKKLLASFLTALGLTTNSANVSANFSQFLSDARFACKILGGQKVKEKNDLHNWIENVNYLIVKNENDFFNKYFSLCQSLFLTLCDIKKHRANYDSILVKNLNKDKIIETYPSNSNNNVDMMQEWLYKVTKLEGGRFTVWDREVKEAVKNLYYKLAFYKPLV